MPVTLETLSPIKLEPAVYPQDARIDAAILGVSLTLGKGTVLGKRTSDNKLYAYDDTKTDGTNVACGILVYDTKTDASGNHYLGTDAVASTTNLPHRDCSVYVAGCFDTTELTGYDAAALADFHGRLMPSGYLRIP